MKVIGATAIGNLIYAHKNGDEEKFNTWANFIADAYAESGNEIAAKLIRDRLNGVKPSTIVVLDAVQFDPNEWKEISEDVFLERMKLADEIQQDWFRIAETNVENPYNFYAMVGDRYFASVQNSDKTSQKAIQELCQWLIDRRKVKNG